jgi:hypothetical protein
VIGCGGTNPLPATQALLRSVEAAPKYAALGPGRSERGQMREPPSKRLQRGSGHTLGKGSKLTTQVDSLFLLPDYSSRPHSALAKVSSRRASKRPTVCGCSLGLGENQKVTRAARRKKAGQTACDVPAIALSLAQPAHGKKCQQLRGLRHSSTMHLCHRLAVIAMDTSGQRSKSRSKMRVLLKGSEYDAAPKREDHMRGRSNPLFRQGRERRNWVAGFRTRPALRSRPPAMEGFEHQQTQLQTRSKTIAYLKKRCQTSL